MTIKEIKDLAKLLTEDEVEKIKTEIRGKEDLLKQQNMDEEEMTQVLNTLFAILVIEKALETEIEGIEDMRAELETDLIEAYEIYDNHMMKYKKEEKKKKKRWLLDFLFLSDRIDSRKDALGASQKELKALKKELNAVKQQKSDANLRKALSNREGKNFDDFCLFPEKCDNPLHKHRESDRCRYGGRGKFGLKGRGHGHHHDKDHVHNHSHDNLREEEIRSDNKDLETKRSTLIKR